MKRLLVLLSSAVLMLIGAPAALAQDPVDPGFVRERPISPDEAAALTKEFNEAVQAARASLPVFWGRLAENRGASPDAFGLKVMFRTPDGGAEDLWLSDIKHDGARTTGRLNYEPGNLPSMHRSQIVPIVEGNIIDWTFKEGRKRYGHFTTRVMAKAQPEEEARTLALLSDNPLPADARK